MGYLSTPPPVWRERPCPQGHTPHRVACTPTLVNTLGWRLMGYPLWAPYSRVVRTVGLALWDMGQ